MTERVRAVTQVVGFRATGGYMTVVFLLYDGQTRRQRRAPDVSASAEYVLTDTRIDELL